MAPTKRNCPSSPQRHAKKAKKDPLAEKLHQQLREITAALKQADTTRDVEKMLELILPMSLGEYSDQRHRFQEQVVKGIAGLLSEVEAALKQDVATKRSERDAAAKDKPQREKEAAEAANKLQAKIAEVHRLKVVLATKAVTFRNARQALADASMAKTVDGMKGKDAEKKKSDFLAAVENLKTLKTCQPDDGEARKREKELMTLLKKHKFEESMLIALPAALTKAPEARGMFDNMAITQLEGEINKLITEQDAILAAAAPGQAKCDAAIKQADQGLVAARGEQRTAAKAFDAASKQEAECETASKDAQKAVRDNTKSSQKFDKALNNAEVEVELFEQGARETFKELCARTTPPPAPEEEEMAEEPAASPTKTPTKSPMKTPVKEATPVKSPGATA